MVLILQTETNDDDNIKTILVVDDEKPIVDILVYNLEKEGYKTLTAVDRHNGS